MAEPLQRWTITTLKTLILSEMNQDVQTSLIQEVVSGGGTTLQLTVPDRITQIIKEAHQQLWSWTYWMWRRRIGSLSVSDGVAALPSDFERIDSQWATDTARTDNTACVFTMNPTYFDAVYAAHRDDDSTEQLRCALIEPTPLGESVTSLVWRIRTAPANDGTLSIIYYASCPAIELTGTALWPVGFDALWHWLSLANCQAAFRQDAAKDTYAKFRSELDRRIAEDEQMKPKFDAVIADAYGDLLSPGVLNEVGMWPYAKVFDSNP